MAVSGIDSTVKIFSPDRQLRQQAKNGIGINNGKNLTSRQRMNEKDDIIGENEVGRQSGLRDAGKPQKRNHPCSMPFSKQISLFHSNMFISFFTFSYYGESQATRPGSYSRDIRGMDSDVERT